MKSSNLLSNLKIGTRLGFSFGIIIVLMLVTITFILTRMNTISNDIDELYDHPFTVSKNLLSADVYIQHIHKYMKDVASAENEEELAIAILEVEKNEVLADLNLQQAKVLFKGDPRNFDVVINKFHNWKPIRDEVISLTKAGEKAEAMSITKGRGERHVVELENSLQSLINFASTKALEFKDNANETSNQALIWGIGVSIFIIIVTIFIAILITNSITKPLTIALQASNKLAIGDTDVDFKTDSNDEIGILLKSMKLMTDSLKQNALNASEIASGNLTIEVKPLSDKDTLGKAFASMLVNLRFQMNEITEGVNVLSSAASEIMSTISQLSSSAAETVTSVSETTSTIEEVKLTAEVSKQKATQMSENSTQNIEISQKGAKSIEETIEGMNKIKQQMESIASIVVRLSEQSQSIGEIAISVNDIAEQSNLLAVNASIEAAKAGEQGKGFSVVAQEIKNLAERSKESTTQIRSILNEIQKAISSAVMATEQGGKVVDDGLELSSIAGEAISTLAASVEESSHASLQIASSSEQQFVGMDQIAAAMENIREASVQTAASTKQSEVSVTDLHKLGEKLQELLKRYKLK